MNSTELQTQKGRVKKAYSSPSLVSYGDLATKTLAKANNSVNGDGGTYGYAKTS